MAAAAATATAGVLTDSAVGSEGAVEHGAVDAGHLRSLRRLWNIGSHREAMEIVTRDTVKVNPGVSEGRLLSGLCFNNDGMLETIRWNHLNIQLRELLESFGTVQTSVPSGFKSWGTLSHARGSVYINCNRLAALPESFGDIIVAGTLHLTPNWLESLPSSFNRVAVGHDLILEIAFGGDDPNGCCNLSGYSVGQVVF